MKKGKTIIILAVVLLALGGLATWDEWQTNKDEQEKAASSQFTEIKPDAVVEVMFQSRPEEVNAPGVVNGVLEVHLVKVDGAWTLSKPIQGPADNASVENLLKAVTDYKYVNAVASDKAKWTEFGLEPPQTQLTFKTADGKEETFYFGIKSPVGYNGYVSTSRSNDVLMGSQHILTAVSKTLFDLRDKSLVKISEADIKTITYQYTPAMGTGTEVFLAKADGRYRYTDDTTSEPDGAYVRDFVEDLNFVRVERFIDNAEEALIAKFQSPEVTVAVTFENRPELRLTFVASNDKIYAQVEGDETIFELPAEFARKIQKKSADFRNRRIVDPQFMSAVTQVTIDGIIYRKIDGNWYTGDELKKAEDPKVEGAQESAHIRPFMVDLEFAKTEDFYPVQQGDYAAAIQQAPDHRIILESSGAQASKITIDLYKHALLPEKFWVKVSGASSGYLVSKGNFDSITPGSDADHATPDLDLPSSEG